MGKAARWLWLAGVPALLLSQAPRMPMPIEFENSSEFRWLNKKVLESRLLDDMSNIVTWSIQGQARSDRIERAAPPGMPALRVEMQMFRGQPPPTRNGLSAVSLKRPFPGEDWSRYNRISLWIRPELSGFPMLPLEIVLRNDGSEKVPDVYHREGIHYVTLQDRKWQHVVWEIAPLARDKVTSLEINYWVNKRLPDADDSVAFEVARLELERVEPDHFEGWSVAPGMISFSNSGYQTGSSKSAMASGLGARDFQLIRLDNNAQAEVVLSKPIEIRDTRFGKFQEMDFSEIRKPGSYVIQAGEARTRPFPIGNNVWTGTIWKAINFFFGERCGFAVPGSHDVCHRDWVATLGDKKIVMNGGWHDAGDLSQGLVNTGEAVYAMFALAERLASTGQDPALLNRLVQEARWGLDWVLKVRFDGGYRIGFASMNIWTNGILGDADDRSREALNNPNVNYIAAAAESIAYRVLRRSDPELAARSLRTAEDDWRYAIEGKEGPETWSTPAFAATPVELAGIGILASLELYQDTGGRQYADKAVELARVIADSQQKTYVGSRFPLAGFLYTGPDKRTLFHEVHRGNDQAPIVAMARLCQAFPGRYSVVALYSEYQKTAARSTAPYGVLPAYVYKDDEYLQVPDPGGMYQATREAFRQQVLGGMPMGDGYYLKAFPVWFARRGNYGVLLSQAKALSAAAQLRHDWDAADLAQKQLQWVVGRNPFVQSTMYGEGYDFTQQYSVSSGDIVGALPVGMETRGNADAPYWPAQNCYVYKEVWVHSTSRWLWLMQDLAGPGLVEGRIAAGAGAKVEFEDTATKDVLPAAVDGPAGSFRAYVPEGRYTVRAGAQHTSITVLPGGAYRLDLRPTRILNFEVKAETSAAGEVTIRLDASGAGRHSFALRKENLDGDASSRELDLQPGKGSSLVWKGRIRVPNQPWVTVVVPDDDVSLGRDLVGSKP
jgi:hypothetical protein